MPCKEGEGRGRVFVGWRWGGGTHNSPQTREVCRLVGTNLRRKSAHAHTFGDFELKIHEFSLQIYANQPANLCTNVAKGAFTSQDNLRSPTVEGRG